MKKTDFDSDKTFALGVAYENAVAAILGKHNAPLRRERVAKVILGIAQRGIVDPTRLYLACLREMRPVSTRVAERMERIRQSTETVTQAKTTSNNPTSDSPCLK